VTSDDSRFWVACIARAKLLCMGGPQKRANSHIYILFGPIFILKKRKAARKVYLIWCKSGG